MCNNYIITFANEVYTIFWLYMIKAKIDSLKVFKIFKTLDYYDVFSLVTRHETIGVAVVLSFRRS